MKVNFSIHWTLGQVHIRLCGCVFLLLVPLQLGPVVLHHLQPPADLVAAHCNNKLEHKQLNIHKE